MSWLKIAAGKSGARELAVALLIFWGFITGWLLWWLEPATVATYRELYGTITMAIFAIAGGAFGVPAVMNRLPGVPGPQPPATGHRSPLQRQEREID